MSILLFGFLLLHLSNCVSSNQSGLDEDAGGALEETMYKDEKLTGIDNKVEKLLQRMEMLEAKNVEVENQLKNQSCKAEVKNELDKVLPTAVEQGLRDLPFEMVCAFKQNWYETSSIVNYDRITVEFNNSDRPGGADGSMNIETGVFTTVTSGHYIVTFSGTAVVDAGEFTDMFLYHNGVKLDESRWYTKMLAGSGDDNIRDQGSRTVVSNDCLLPAINHSLRFHLFRSNYSQILSFSLRFFTC